MFRNLRFLVIFMVGLCLSGPGNAEESPLQSATLERVGFQGRFKVGQWTPFTVLVETASACQLELTLEASDPDGNRAVWPAEFAVPSAGTHRLTMLFQPGRLETTLRPRIGVKTSEEERPLTIPILAGEGPAAQLTQRALTQSVLLVGTLGNPGGLTDKLISGNDPNEPNRQDSQVPIQVAALSTPSELVVSQADDQSAAFINASGLEALDTLVISGQYEMDARQSEAVKTWVTLGGHLIVAVGQDLETYQSSPLAQWLTGDDAGEDRPFRLTGTTAFRSLSTLENFAGKNAAPIKINLQNPVSGVKIELGKNAESLLSVLTGPLIARAPYGFGTVTFMGLSLNEEPVKSWPSLPRAMRKLFWDVREPTRSLSKSQGNQLAYSGVSEFATQLHTALQTFRPVNRLSTWSIIGLMGLYLLVIGPLDYFLVHQVFGKPRLTWLTFPALVGVAAVLGVWLSRTHNGEALLTSQVNVLDYDASTKTLRSRSWMSIYSPETRRYQISLEPKSLRGPRPSETVDPPAVRMSWFGIPETTFGGMYREGGQSLSPPLYRFAPQAKSIDNLPIPIWGAKTLKGEWCEQGENWVEGKLESPRPGQLRGTIRHHFPVPITDWFLAYDTRVFLPRPNLATGEADSLPPDADWPRNDVKWERVRQREISGYLTRAVAKQFQRKGQNSEKIDTIRMEQDPYDPLAADNLDPLGNIVRILTFHRQVGGKQYTGMDNHALRDMDLSGRLGLRRAVLYGRLDLSPADLRIQDHDPQEIQQATFVRIILPVEIHHTETEPLLKLKDPPQ